MKRIASMLMLAGLMFGCTPQKPAPTTTTASASPVLDVSPTPASSNASVSAVSYPAPEPAITQTPTAPTAGSSYTVKKGDTLFHIAKDHYGDGKKWQQIAAANPGVSPTSLHVGQTLVMP